MVASVKNFKDRHRLVAVFVLVSVLVLLLLVSAFLGEEYNLRGRPSELPTSFGQSATPTHSEAEVPEPVRLRIPSIQVDAAVMPVGVAKDNSLEVPGASTKVGWFKYGAKPGASGPAVLVGHLDSATGPAVFIHLRTIKIGDLIHVARSDNSEVVYKVDSIAEFPQDNFPTQAVYGPIAYPGIRLITCSGTYSRQQARYSHNLVVFGSLASSD